MIQSQPWKAFERLEPVYYCFGKLPELRGVLRCERLEEPGIGKGVSGKIGKHLFTHVKPVESGPRCVKAASITAFGTGLQVTLRVLGEPVIENWLILAYSGRCTTP